MTNTIEPRLETLARSTEGHDLENEGAFSDCPSDRRGSGNAEYQSALVPLIASTLQQTRLKRNVDTIPR